MPKNPRRALLLAPLALLTACNPALHDTGTAPGTRADAKPAPALAAAPFEKALGTTWHLTYRDIPGTPRRMADGKGAKGLRVGIVETKGTGGTLTSLTCQAFGKDTEEATRFLLACAKAATPATPPPATPANDATATPVHTWLTTHTDRPSTGPGHTTTHGPLTYHLGVNPDHTVRVLHLTPSA